MEYKNIALFLPLAFVVLVLSGCGTIPMVNSAWLDHNLSFSTGDTTWLGGLKLLGDLVSLSVSNNRDFLYAAIVVKDSPDPDVAAYSHSLAAKGLTLWIDPRGGDQRALAFIFVGWRNRTLRRPPAMPKPRTWRKTASSSIKTVAPGV